MDFLKRVIRKKDHDFMQIRLLHACSLIGCGREPQTIRLDHRGERGFGRGT